MAERLSLRNVTIGYQQSSTRGASEPTTILQNFSLTLGECEFLVIVGASGVGKSTLLRVVAGLIEPLDGRVERPAGGRFGFVFQEPRLLPWRRVLSNVTLGLERSLDRAQRVERAREMLRLVGLAGLETRFPGQLSGGQKQRVGIARALAISPEVLLMDEPFGALDAVTRRSLQQELLSIWKSTRTSVMFVTHDVEEAALLADRILLLGGEPGRVVQEYRPTLGHPRSSNDPQFRELVWTIRRDLDAHQDAGGL
ncbi:MAG: ABC transporter ATP-binding protein [Spirochaetaceae bacterium]